MQKIKINEKQSPKRFDVVAHVALPGLSRSSVQKLIEQGKILVNSNQEKTGYKLKTGDVVSIDFDEQELQHIPKIELPIIYEDNDCIVIDKPVGVLSHSKGAFNPEPTVASFIANNLSNLSGDRAGIVHRLDRATSGIMICAKNPQSQAWLQKQFANRKVKKTYQAVIKTGLKPSSALIDMPIERNPKIPKQYRVGTNGKTAKTNYQIIKDNEIYCLLKLEPETGRTHQLRVHLNQLGFPIVGDQLYGGMDYDRMLLHATELEIIMPNKSKMVFKSTLPSEFINLTE